MNNNTGQESPFIYGKMIKDPDLFWGRFDESYELRTRLYNMESTSIVGPRRIGKSSLAHFILSTSKEHFDDTYNFVWLDAQSNHARSVQDFCASVTSRGYIAYIPGDNQKDCLKNFEDAISSCEKKLVLIINEFELLTDEEHSTEFGIPFFNTLRMLAEQSQCALITTSYRPIQELCKHILGISSPFYNILPQITLSNFTDDDVDSFLKTTHNGITLNPKEISLIKNVPNYHHPMVLQIACHHSFLNRKLNLLDKVMISKIVERSNSLLNSDEVQKERIMAKGSKKDEKTLSKPLDLTLSILIPILGIGFLMGEFALVIKYLNDVALIVILAIFSILVGFAVMIFAGRSIDIIGETTFFKLFTRLIEQIPLLSNILTTITNSLKKSKK